MKTVVRYTAMAGVAFVCMFLLSASTWEGTAILGSYGDFPANGYYAACNSFPRNTVVEVTNVDNGLKVKLIITRNLDNAGVFMLLSAEAAQALGVMQGVVARVSATEPKSSTELSQAKKPGSAAFDPDFDPKRMAEAELKKLGYVVEPAAPVSAPVAPAAVAPVVQKPVAVPAVVPAAVVPTAVAPTAMATSGSPDALATRLSPPASSSTPLPSPVPQNFTPVERQAAVSSALKPGTESPTVINGKPKPVRTIILAALPEPQAAPRVALVSSAKIPETAPKIETPVVTPVTGVKPDVSTTVQKAPLSATVMVAPAVPLAAREKPEVIDKSLPSPDETPVIVKQSPAPKRLEAASVYPDTYVRSPSIPMVPDTVITAKVSEPALVRAQTLDRSKAANIPTSPYIVLAEPTMPRAETAIVLDRNGRPAINKIVTGTLSDPNAPRTESATVLDRNSLTWANGTVNGELRDPSEPRTESATVLDRNSLSWANGTVNGELRDPAEPRTESATVLDRNSLTWANGTVNGELRDPASPRSETASVLDRNAPGYSGNSLAVDLAMPELVPDELPQIVLRSLGEPKVTIPETNLADGEIQFAEEEKAVAMSFDTPYYDAAETVVELAEANEKESEKPLASIQGPVPAGTPLVMSLADAAEQKAESTSARPAPLVASKTTLPPLALADATVAPGTKAPAAAAVPAAVQSVAIAPAKGDTIVTLTPAAPKAPGTMDALKPVSAAVLAPAGLSALKKDFFYIQLAAYGSEPAVREAAGRLSKKYITIVETVSVKGKPVFRLYVGPLSRDESGVALVQVRALGFKDAFIKQGS